MRAARSLSGSSASATETLSRARPAVADLARLRIDVDPNTWSLAICSASPNGSTTNSNAILRHHAREGSSGHRLTAHSDPFAVIAAAVITRSHFPRQNGTHRATPVCGRPMDWSIPHLLYEEDSFGVFVLVTLAMGGGAAWASGRAIAATWRPWWQIVAYMLILAGAVRFIHFALFDGTLLSLHYYVVDAAVCLFFGFFGFRVTRAGQMATQYGFLNERTGLLSWARRAAASRSDRPTSVWLLAELALQSPGSCAGGGAAESYNTQGDIDEKTDCARPRPRHRPGHGRHRPGAGQVRRHRALHRPECGLRRADQERRRSGDRGRQCDRRQPWAEDRPRIRGRCVRPQAGRVDRQQVRGRRDQVRDGAFQLRRDHAGLGGLPGKRHPPDHAVRHQPEDHRARHVEHLPHLRA